MSDIKKHLNIAEGFQYSVNIEYDLGNEEKIKGFIPTTATFDIIEDIMLSTHVSSTDRARILIGAYGKGKSHFVLVVLSLLMSKNTAAFEGLLSKIKEYNPKLHQFITDYLNSDKKLLPIIIQGGNSSLSQSFLSAMQRTLEMADLADLMPDTHFTAAIEMIKNWEDNYPATFEKLKNEINEPITEFIDKLTKYDTKAYKLFEKLYPGLTSGGAFNPFVGLNVVDLYEDVTKKLKSKGYSGIYVIYDEFSKFLEADITKINSVDIRLLQDFAEKCNRSAETQMHIMLISHKDISNYIDKLPKQKVDGWRGVSERFKHVELKNNFSQIYEIIATVIGQDEKFFKKYFADNKQIFDDCLNTYKNQTLFSELDEAIVSDELFNKTKSKECKPRKGVELGTTLFSGKVVCGCCGRSLYTWSKNHVLFCQTPTLSDDNPGCYDKKIHEDELIALVYDAIKFASFNSKEKIAKFKNDVAATTNELGLVKREIQNEVGRLDRLKLKKEKLFQKLMDNQMSDDEYMKLSDEVEREQIAVEDKIRDLKKKQKTVLAKKKEEETTVKTYKEIGAIKKIDRNVVDKFINKMIVSKEGRVELEWNFKNIFVC